MYKGEKQQETTKTNKKQGYRTRMKKEKKTLEKLWDDSNITHPLSLFVVELFVRHCLLNSLKSENVSMWNRKRADAVWLVGFFVFFLFFFFCFLFLFFFFWFFIFACSYLEIKIKKPK